MSTRAETPPEGLGRLVGEVRVARLTDWRTLRDLRTRALDLDENLFFSDPSEKQRSADDWRAVLKKETDTWFVAWLDDEPVGCALVIDAEDGVHAQSVWVAPAHRRTGVATALMRQICHHAATALGATELKVWVLQHNEPAKRLYDGLVFKPTYERNELPERPDVFEERHVLDLT